MKKSNFVRVPINRGFDMITRLNEKENMVVEKMSDALYLALVRRFRKYRKGALIIRASGKKSYSVELDSQVFYYSVIWGTKSL